jgi:hypothetical protein
LIEPKQTNLFMKKATLLLSAIMICCCSFSSTTSSAPSHSNSDAALPPGVMKMIETLTPKQFEKATGKKLRFKDRIAYRLLQWKLRKQHHNEVDEVHRKQGHLSLLLGIASVVFLFIPEIGILSIGLAIAAIVLGILSLRGNSNTPGVIGIVCGGTVLFAVLLAVIVLTSSGWF